MWRTKLLSVLVGIVILGLGVVAMAGLLHFKRTPAEASVEDLEKPIVVEARRVDLENAPVIIRGYGTVEAVHEVALAPEVSGRVVSVHPNLIEGGLVRKGELLFEIEPDRYTALASDAAAQVRIQEEGLERLRGEWRNESSNVRDLRRNLELALKNYTRAQELFGEGIGSQAEVDRAEERYVVSKNEVEGAERAAALYPARIREQEAHLDGARANLKLAEFNLRKTVQRAPFDARIKVCMIEEFQMVNAGENALTLVNDDLLEIAVPLNSREARKWLQFEENPDSGSAWFNALKPVACAVRWTEDTEAAAWTGRINRVRSYDPESHTVTVAIRLERGPEEPDQRTLPLVEGMFCEVQIPGRELRDVIAVDNAIINFDNTIYVAKEDRLETRTVAVARNDGSRAYISEGLSPGDVVITTRLVDPLENALLDLTLLEEEADS